MTSIRIPPRAARLTAAQFDVLNARAADLRAQGHDVISLGQALPGFGPPDAAIDAARDALTGRAAHVYSADAGNESLRVALSDALRVSGQGEISPGELIITAGGNQAFMLALMTLVDPGDEVLLPAPYFVNHEMAVAVVGAVPKEVPIAEARGFAACWEDLEPHVSSRTRAVAICTPSNPTGAVVSPREIGRMAAALAARDVLLIVDETYARFVYEGEFTSVAALPNWRDNVIVVSTFSKSFGMTGWRVGYMAAPAAVCDQAIKVQDAMIICAPVPAQIGVEAAIRQVWEYPETFKEELMSRRNVLAASIDQIPQLSWTQTEGGFFAFVRVEDCTDSASLARDLLDRAHVVTIPGSTFGRCGEGYIRLSYSAVSADELRSAMSRIQRFFRE